MRTLEQIDQDITRKAIKRAKELTHHIPGEWLTETEITYMQITARFGDKYRMMYHILRSVDEFLEDPNNKALEKHIKRMLKKL